MPFAAVAGAAVAGGIGLVGSSMQAGATGKAAGQAQQRFEQTRTDLAPYREAGLAPLQAQNALLGLSGQDAADAAMRNFQASPGYGYQVSEGLRAVDAGAASRGYLRSGATIKAEETLGSNLANQDFGNYYNRLMGLTSLGASAAAGEGPSNIAAGQAAQSAGNTQASIYGDAAKGLGSAASGLFANPDIKSGFNSLFSGDISSNTLGQNALYQQNAFAAQPSGTYGPFK